MMITWNLFKRQNTKKRSRRINTQRGANGGAVSPKKFFSRPGLAWCGWGLIWVTAIVLRVWGTTGIPQDISPGMPAPSTIRSSISFVVPDARTVLSDNPLPDNGQSFPGGTVLVERGEILAAEAVAIINAYQQALQTPAGRLQWSLRLGGDALILLVALIATFILMRRVGAAESVGRNRLVWLLWLLSSLSLAPAQWLMTVGRDYPVLAGASIEFLLPLALGPLMAAILLGALPAAITAFWIAIAGGILADYSLPVFILAAVQGMVVINYAHRTRTRMGIFRMGLLIGLAGAVCAVGFGLTANQPGEVILVNCALGFGAGFAAALTTLLLLPLLEAIFGIATDISMLELADMEHPLLKRLAIEAPGTYQHSIMVANLAQAGAMAINANSLRTRIIAYFHDIGKLVKPGFFSENIQFNENPHDDLTPTMSCLVIISHVKEGISLAVRHKLPQPVMDGIEQHHGTGIVSYFFHKATNAKKPHDANLNSDDFRYPGPKPRARETVVLCLADSIEAASRSLEKITPASIEGLVTDIINERLRDGQLDACDLTMAEIRNLKRVFVFTLTNMLHGRISYPTDENRNKPETKTDSNKSAAPAQTDEPTDGASRQT